MSSKTKLRIQLTLPGDIIEAVRSVAKLAGLDVSDVISVILALELKKRGRK